MTLVTTCCGLWDLRAGSRNIAVISMVYDLFMTAALLLTLLLYMPHVKWAEGEQQPDFYASHSQACQILLIITISVLALHSIPSFLLLYSTWEEVTRGVGFWLFMTVLALLVHLAWILVPFWFQWSMELMIIHVTTLGLVSLFIFYFICVVSNYRQRVNARDNDVRSKRRLI